MPFGTGFPGNGTPYRRTKLLTSNTEYNCTENTVQRIWPRNELPRLTVEEAATRVVTYSSIALENFGNTLQLKLGLTAGLDSRLQLAILLKSRMSFEAYTYGSSANTLIDRSVATHISERFGFKHSVVPTRSASPQMNDQLLKASYNRHHRSAVEPLREWFGNTRSASLMSATLEIGRSTYRKAELEGFPPPLDGEKMYNLWFRYIPTAERNKVVRWGLRTFKYVAVPYFEDLIDETEFVQANEYINLYVLQFWEHRMSAWLGVANAERDFYAEPLIPFNARNILTSLLGVSHDDRQSASVFYEAIRQTTPSLLDIPINPREWK